MPKTIRGRRSSHGHDGTGSSVRPRGRGRSERRLHPRERQLVGAVAALDGPSGQPLSHARGRPLRVRPEPAVAGRAGAVAGGRGGIARAGPRRGGGPVPPDRPLVRRGGGSPSPPRPPPPAPAPPSLTSPSVHPSQSRRRR